MAALKPRDGVGEAAFQFSYHAELTGSLEAIATCCLPILKCETTAVFSPESEETRRSKIDQERIS
jgi:hypothetical protein